MTGASQTSFVQQAKEWLRLIRVPEEACHLLITEASSFLTEGMDEEAILSALLTAAVQNIAYQPSFEVAAKRLLLLKIYREAVGEPFPDYATYFPRYIQEGVARGVLHPDLLRFDLSRLAAAIVPERDEDLPYIGIYTLYDRYLVRDVETRKVLETPQAMWMRVAMGLSLKEPNPNEWALRFYEMFSTLRYLPSTPTLFNSGTPHHQLASCYLYDVHDSLEHILEAAYEFGMLAKYAGGIGTAVTKIRAVGSPVKGINGKSGGLIPFLHMYDALIKSISQGGRRRGTMCVYLEPWHLEIEAFLDLKRNSGDPYLRTPSLNTALFIPDEFFRRVQSDDDWYLFDPLYTQDLSECYGQEFSQRYRAYIEKAEQGELPKRAWRKVKAKQLYLKILASLMETGHPWLTFKDATNARSMLKGVGVIHSLNLCTEVALPTNRDEIAVCNLASVNLSRHLREDGEIDFERLAETVRVAVRGLDNVIDLNLYPSEKAKRSNLQNRPIGLGVMGFAELLARKGIPYDRPEAADLADRLMEFISYHAILTSHELAKERGVFPRFSQSEWAKGRVPIDTLADLERERGEPIAIDRKERLDWHLVREKVKEGMRNGTVMAVAPTATIALIAGTSTSLDPYFANIFSRQTLSGKFVEFNPVLVETLKRLGLWEKVRERLIAARGDLTELAEIPEDIKRCFPTAFHISPDAYLSIAAKAQKWVDMAISRSLFFNARHPSDIAEVYLRAWQMGLKSTYYCFVNPRMQAEPSTVWVNKRLQKPKWVLDSQKEMGLTCPLDGGCESCQ